MHNSKEQQELELLESIGLLIKAIDDSVDWFIAYIQEPDEHKKKLFELIHESKCKKLTKIAEEEHDRHK